MSALRWLPADQQAAYHDRAVEVMRMAYAHEGKRAFESTKRCAAIHEAGHCVINQLTADRDCKGMWWPPARTRIWREPVKGMVCWLGETTSSKKAPPFFVDPRTDLRGYLILALRTVGGIAAEWIFDREDYRAGSSIDEMLIAGGCARSLQQLGIFTTADDALQSLVSSAAKILTAHESVVRAIARALERELKVEGPALVELLREVRP